MKKLSNTKTENFSLSPAVKRKVKVLIGKLAEVDGVTKTLQQSAATVRSSHAYFDANLEDYQRLSERFDPDARIVQHPFFETEI